MLVVLTDGEDNAIHVDVSGMTRALTWGSFIGGLVGWTVGTGVVGATLALVYNRLLRAGGQ